MANNIIDIFSGKPMSDEPDNQIIRLSPEIDGFSLLHSFYEEDDQLTIIPILCWGLQKDGAVVAMVPWQQELRSCADFDNEELGFFHGYYDPKIDSIFETPPLHKALDLESSVNYFEDQHPESSEPILQEIVDHIGTHALLLGEEESNLILTEVLSWRLLKDGTIHGMLINHDKVENTPVLVGDASLYAANEHPRFRFYFQHHIANQIKKRDPEVLADIARLLEEQSLV